MFNIDTLMNINEPQSPIDGLAEGLLNTYREYLLGEDAANTSGAHLVSIQSELLLDQIARFIYAVGIGYAVDKLACDMTAVDRHNNLGRFIHELSLTVGIYSLAAVQAEGGHK